MGALAHRFFLLRGRRTRRRDLLVFLDVVAVGVQAGYDLAFAWPQALRDLTGELQPDFRARLTPAEGQGFQGFLSGLACVYPDTGARLWFQILAELYVAGSPIAPTLQAFSKALRQELDRDWQAHLRSVPLKNSLVLALFFLGPALALVFLPLLAELAESFR